METKKRRKRCIHCLEIRDDVKKRIDPYAQGLHEIETKIDLCDECAEERALSV